MSRRDPTSSLVTALREQQGDPDPQLAGAVYDELRRVASALLSRERREHTLQPTALVHEAWLRLVDVDGGLSADADMRRRFVGLAARAMRQILVDHARSRGAEKRGGNVEHVTLPLDVPVQGVDLGTLLDLDAVLEQLGQCSERLARLAELRLFGGLAVSEAAAVLDVSLSTAKAEWALIRGILIRMLDGRGPLG